MPNTDLIAALYVARRQARVLPANHPSVTEAVANLLEKIEAGLRDAPSVTVSILGSELYWGGHLLAQDSITYEGLVRELAARKLDSVVFARGLALHELVRFIALTNKLPDEIAARGGWKSILEQEMFAHISAHQVAGLDRAVTTPNAKVAIETYKLGLESITASFHEVRENGCFDLGNIQQRVKMLLTVMMDDAQVFHNLSTIKNKDEYTFYHSINVAVLSILLGFKLQMDPALLELVGTAAILHDLGKMRVPLDILNKPGEFTKTEWDIMRGHAIEGAKILLQVPETQAIPMVVAAQHHAGHSLGGYPVFPGLDRLHLVAELVSVADVFDALTSDRPYRAAMLPDHSMKIIVGGSGRQFHPVLVKAFAQMSGMFPVGTLVELDTGELAVVVRPNPKDLFRPTVRILDSGSDSQPDTAELELGEHDPDNTYPHSIVRSVDPKKHNIKASSLVLGALA